MKTILKTTTKSYDFDDEIVISISRLGFIKRMPLARILSLTHGDVGNNAFYTRENDFVEYISLATIQGMILFFTSLGRCYWLKVCDIPENSSNTNEYRVHDLLKIAVDDYIKAFILVEDYTNEAFLNSHYTVFCTKNGIVKKTCLREYLPLHNGTIRRCANGLTAIYLREGDALVKVIVTNGKNDLMLASREGRAIRFNESQIIKMGRISTGVSGLRLPNEKDDVVGIIQINDDQTESIMFVCNNGYGICTKKEDFRVTNRANIGLKVTNITNETGKVVDFATVTNDTDLIIFSKSGVINRIKANYVPIKKRATSCLKLIEAFPKNDQIICVLKVNDFDKPGGN